MFGWLREEAASASCWNRRDALLVGRETSGQQLEGDAAIEALVVREEDLTHAAPADPIDHAVTADELADRRPGFFAPVALDR